VGYVGSDEYLGGRVNFVAIPSAAAIRRRIGRAAEVTVFTVTWLAPRVAKSLVDPVGDDE
jgi:hypothetical protein